MAFLHKSSKMLYFLDTGCEDWTSVIDGACLTQVLKRGDPWPRPFQARVLTDPEVEHPRSLAEFPGYDQGFHERFRDGYSDAWQHYITACVQAAAASLPPPHQSTSITLVDVSPVASLKTPYGPLTFPASSTAAPGAGLSPAFNTPSTVVSRTAETFFCLPAPFISFMQADTPFSQVLPKAAQSPGHAFPLTLSSANVFAPLSLRRTIVFSIINAPVSRPAVVPPSSGLLHSPAGPGAITSLDQAACDSAFTGQHSDAFTSWSHLASASGPSAWHDIRDIVIDEGSLMQEHSASSNSELTPQLSNYLLNLQHFSTTQFEARPLVHTRALLALIEGMGYHLEEGFAPAERPGQLYLSVVTYLQIVSELPSDRVVELNLQVFNSLVSKTIAKLYPAVARCTRPRPVSFVDLLELSHLVVREPFNVLSREPPTFPTPVLPSLLAPTILPPTAEHFFKTLQSSLPQSPALPNC